MHKKIIIIYALILAIAGSIAVLFINSNLVNHFPSEASLGLPPTANFDEISSKKSDLGFGTSGKVVSISKKVGDSVKAGDILARIDNTGALAQYEQAQSGVSAAQSNLAALQNALKTQELKLKGLRSNDRKIQNQQIKLAQNSVDAQSAAVQQAMDNLNNVKSQLDKYVIKAPFDGIITRQDIELGEIVNPNVPVIVLEAE